MKPNFLLMLSLIWLGSGACLRHSAEAQQVVKEEPTPTVEDRSEAQMKYYTQLQQILDSAKLKGAFLIFDPQRQVYHSNDFRWAKTPHLPASTFKIPNSIVALENDILQDPSSMILWDGKPRRMKAWEEDMTLAQAFMRSCLPCYQKLARETGMDRMRATLDRIDYPGMIFDAETVDDFWVIGPSAIDQFQQVDFLQRLHDQQLDIKPSTYQAMLKIMKIEVKGGYELYAKTGWSIVGEKHNGWFVGWIETKGNSYFFATNVSPGMGYDMDNFSQDRKKLTMAAFNELGILAAQ